MTSCIEEFSEILRHDEPLAQHTWFRIGGPARFFLTPRTKDELLAVVRCCRDSSTPLRILGGGSNLLVRDEGFEGAVIQIAEPLLGAVRVEGQSVIAEGGALLSHTVSEAVRNGLAGLEHLVGIPGTVGAAVYGNSGGRVGDIGELVRHVTVLTQDGEIAERRSEDLTFAYRRSSIHDLAVLEARFELRPEGADELVRRMKQNWILKRATQPLQDQSAGCIFRNPRGLSAGALIEQCGLKSLSCGKARVSDRHANFIVTEDGATCEEVRTLISRIQSAVQEKFAVELELEIKIW